MEVSLLTPKCTLVPSHFFNPSSSREALAEVVALKDTDVVRNIAVPQYDAVLLYAGVEDETLSREIESDISDGQSIVLPEMFFILRNLPSCRDYNKILASWKDGYLHLAIAQGGSLMLCNIFRAPDFTTAEYFIFLAMKSLQLNPEVSTICWRTDIDLDEEMSLYRYFKAVEKKS